MIKLELPEKPGELTDELVRQLTERFKADGSDVWKMKFIEDAVYKIAFGKCCYTESRLGEEGKYLEIDHFHNKRDYPDKVVEWGNLLPSNKTANTTKGTHDVVKEPIINPLFDDPKDHLYIKAYRFYHKTEKGRLTIDKVALNDALHFVSPRAIIGTVWIDKLEDFFNEIKEEEGHFIENHRKASRFLKKFKNLLRESTKENIYSATLSTVILSDQDFYPTIVGFLKQNNLWDAELDRLVKELEFCALLK